MKRWVWVVCAMVLGCGDDDRPGGRDGAVACTSDEACDDGFECTIDTCGVGGACRYDPIDERCTDGLVCEPGRGCVGEASCADDADCDDGFECTIDRCGVGGECAHTGVDERCDGPGSVCDPVAGVAPTGCTEATGCASDADCDDSLDCTVDACGVEETCTFTPVDERCADGETCSPISGCFENMPCTTDAECDDGNFCNGTETCIEEFGCQPPEMARMCDDTDDCTMDSCDATLDMCVFACDTTRPECDCPVVETPCSGIFDITPAPTQSCAFGQVAYNVTELEFTCLGPVLSVDARNVPNAMVNAQFTQSPRSMDGTFDIEAVVEGTCEETYRIQGTFTDANTFTATWTASYSGFDCGFSGCMPQTTMITGTRR